MSDLSDQGVMAKVTICADCGASLDYRPLREVDVSSSDAELPVYEANVQAQAKIAKAKEVREESGEQVALPEHPTEEKRKTEHAGVVPCTKHGGEIEPCSTGSGKAHHCHHSKWGSLRTFNRPCPCLECHQN
jgi:hypothetical protein